MNEENQGNVLFLILVAVVLFAALSYAVTQSSRGGGNVSEEQMQLKMSQVMQQAAQMKYAVDRLYLMNTVEQIEALDSTALNNSGTVELPGGGTTTGVTVGLFEPSIGTGTITPPQDIFEAGTGSWQYFNTYSFSFAGEELGGTSDFDEVIALSLITPEACAAINKMMHGDSSEVVGTSSGSAYTYTHTGCNTFNGTDRWFIYPLKGN